MERIHPLGQPSGAVIHRYSVHDRGLEGEYVLELSIFHYLITLVWCGNWFCISVSHIFWQRYGTVLPLHVRYTLCPPPAASLSLHQVLCEQLVSVGQVPSDESFAPIIINSLPAAYDE